MRACQSPICNATDSRALKAAAPRICPDFLLICRGDARRKRSNIDKQVRLLRPRVRLAKGSLARPLPSRQNCAEPGMRCAIACANGLARPCPTHGRRRDTACRDMQRRLVRARGPTQPRPSTTLDVLPYAVNRARTPNPAEDFARRVGLVGGASLETRHRCADIHRIGGGRIWRPDP
jgi:hypothetical protein